MLWIYILVAGYAAKLVPQYSGNDLSPMHIGDLFKWYFENASPRNQILSATALASAMTLYTLLLAIGVLGIAIAIVIFISERQHMKIRHLAYHDALTGLHNRRFFNANAPKRLLRDDAILYPQSGVPNDVAPGEILVGTPAFEVSAFWRAVAVFKKLGELPKRIRALEKRLDEVEKSKPAE